MNNNVHDKHSPRSPADEISSRRQFLGGVVSLTGVTAVGQSARLPGSSSRAAGSTGRDLVAIDQWTLKAHRTSYTFGEGTTVPYYRYRGVEGGEHRGSLPYFEATEGTQVLLKIINQLPVTIRPSIMGEMVGPKIPAGEMRTWTFVMPRAGSYLLGQAGGGLRPGVPTGAAPDAAPGLSAMVVSRPASGANELWDGGPGFDREYVLVYEDADLRDDVPAGPVPYEPNFFTVNGLAFPDLAGDSDSVVAASLGERILIRTGNLGGWVQAIHFHGFHVDIVARNNAPETVLPPKDTYRLPSNKTVDVILTASQVGVYPLHPHSLTTTTANGHYPFGQITLIQIT